MKATTANSNKTRAENETKNPFGDVTTAANANKRLTSVPEVVITSPPRCSSELFRDRSSASCSEISCA